MVEYTIFLSANLISLHLAKARFQHRLFICAPAVSMKSPVKAFSTNQRGIFFACCPKRASLAFSSYGLKLHRSGGEAAAGTGKGQGMKLLPLSRSYRIRRKPTLAHIDV